MAITNAQQYKQLMNEGGPMRKIKGQDHMLAYITPSEKDMLVDLGGQETMTTEGILAYPPGMGDPNYDGSGGGTYSGSGGNRGGNKNPNEETGGNKRTSTSNSNARENYIRDYVSRGIVKGGGPKIGTDASGNSIYADARLTEDQINKSKDFQQVQKFKTNFEKKTPFDYVPSTGKFLSKFFRGNTKYKREFLANNPQLLDYFNSLTEEEQQSNKAMVALKDIENLDGQTYADFLAFNKGAPGLKEAGNVGNLEKFAVKDADGNTIGYDYKETTGGGNNAMSDYERRLLELEQAVAATPETTPVEEDQIINYRLMADGGRAGFAEGGMPYEGGIMDLETSRQMYGLGKFVKKITRGVKKIAKSPIGKAALGAALFKFGGGKGIMGKLFGLPGVDEFGGTPGFLNKLGLTSGFGSYMPTALGGIAASTLGSYFLTPKDEDDEEELYAGADLPNPVEYYLSGQYTPNRRLAAEGGSMDEPVAKKTMPLLDMDGQEMDLRAEGGFVPLGRMERADDVPARLSKNEFVFTADAVRNAGEGDVDKGAEVMYNMMKNLESGGEVSEESQGLEGAREMFQTSQRLEEVI